ncbi:hypothetical protein ARALYDRAFT_897979 [Arabidopsis lyrata subsp. lyrata]|uniref:Uncharacterized protein n=1 Tax=Arabidopsis lyrata subsp. lyrata TaxID=81972 RepID=D7L648_ARALL|nr:uncharacterized protein LOC9321220 [Arabidopsis lyrata subsp. lyrata]EFH59274.1 hypothetical protein ARALYDRAFT_897979 [Arabidopsis lyrata subsp. lyrata]|eukprot:XP_002883015.1 uncharacterized protein LOC9321220 [Arabidopsis lyrata subsp. lyrata]
MPSTPISHVLLRRKRRLLAPDIKFYPYATGRPSSGKKDMKEEVVRLGVDLSLSVAESMFLLSDDIHTLLWFCYKLWRCTIPHWELVSERLLRVIYHVYSKDIKPKKNAVHQNGANSAQFHLIRATWKDFSDGIIVLHRLVKVLRRNDWSFDDPLLSSAIAKCKQVLKRLEDELRSAKHVSESNGFAREIVESNTSALWESLFDEEAVDLWKSSLFDEEAGEEPANEIKIRILRDLFHPIMGGNSWHGYANPKAPLGHIQMQSLPVYSPYIPPVYSPYILGKDFAKQELKEEVVRLGVELSLHVAGSMLYLCDDIRSMLRFCYKFLEDARKDLAPDSPVMKSLLGVIHYVNSKYIKPKNGVCQNGGHSVQSVTLESFGTGIRDLDLLVSILRSGVSYLDAREYTSTIEAALKEVDETLRCAKDVLEANGFARDAMESKILDLWKPLFDKETEESWSLSAVRLGIFSDLFHPLVEEKSSKT